jgi:hypothetical protein
LKCPSTRLKAADGIFAVGAVWEARAQDLGTVVDDLLGLPQVRATPRTIRQDIHHGYVDACVILAKRSRHQS